MGIHRFTDLRAWQACYAYKNAVYKLTAACTNRSWRDQMEDAVSGPPGHIAEGFGRFNPADFNRFLVIARSSLMESQNHLRDAADRGYITEEVRAKHDLLAEAALGEVTGLMEYLQSPEALRNARRARERRIASRPERRAATLQQNEEPGTQNNEPGTNDEPGTKNDEPGTEPEHEPRTQN